MFETLQSDLQALSDADRRRILRPILGSDFSSNDYLGLAASGALRGAAEAALASGAAIGSGGSRLLRGNHPAHEALEMEAAAFLGSEAALWFPTGFTANSAFFATVPQKGDCIIVDTLIHASVHEGLRLTRGTAMLARHNDAGHFEELAQGYRTRGGVGTIWIAVESLYSMDGDFAPLPELAAIAARFGAVLVIDEAHATGLYGPQGAGFAKALRANGPVVSLHTFGKALGCEGALLACDAVVRDFLINRARGFIFSTAPSPLMAAIARAALVLVRDGDHLRADLFARIEAAEAAFARFAVHGKGSPIKPIIIGEDGPTMAVAAALQERGHDVRGIRPPTVPEGTGRLRITITRNVDEADIARLAADLAELMPDGVTAALCA